MTDACKPRVFALVLAAGSASRFGTTKQLAKVDGRTLVRRAVDAATTVCDNRVILVTGHDWQAVSDAGLPAGGFLVRNESFIQGMGTSLSLGVRTIRHAADAILVLLADQPLVTPSHLGEITATWTGAADEIVATGFNGSMGPPVLFGRDCFNDLAQLAGDSGGKQLLDDDRFQLRTIAFDPAAIDIDSPGDLDQFEA